MLRLSDLADAPLCRHRQLRGRESAVRRRTARNRRHRPREPSHHPRSHRSRRGAVKTTGFCKCGDPYEASLWGRSKKQISRTFHRSPHRRRRIRAASRTAPPSQSARARRACARPGRVCARLEDEGERQSSGAHRNVNRLLWERPPNGRKTSSRSPTVRDGIWDLADTWPDDSATARYRQPGSSHHGRSLTLVA
jgi:hypothetical protein